MESVASVFSASAAAGRLEKLGLESEPLRDVVRRSFHAYIECSPNYPPLARGISAWGEAVSALREYTLPRGFRRSDRNNYSIVVDDEHGLAISVATGDEATGIIEASPTTRSVKGVSTVLAVVANQAQLSLFSEGELPPYEASEDDSDLATWVLLIHRAKHEVRCELSFPSAIGVDGRISAWHERIILEPVALGDPQVQIDTPAPAPDIEVDVRRRA